MKKNCKQRKIIIFFIAFTQKKKKKKKKEKKIIIAQYISSVCEIQNEIVWVVELSVLGRMFWRRGLTVCFPRHR